MEVAVKQMKARLGSPLPRQLRDWARRCHIRAGIWLRGKKELDDLKNELPLLFRAASHCNNVCKFHGLAEIDNKLSIIMTCGPLRASAIDFATRSAVQHARSNALVEIDAAITAREDLRSPAPARQVLLAR
jgi:hypothetical protein